MPGVGGSHLSTPDQGKLLVVYFMTPSKKEEDERRPMLVVSEERSTYVWSNLDETIFQQNSALKTILVPPRFFKQSSFFSILTAILSLIGY